MGKVTVTVLGGGNGAFAAAADLMLRGYDVRLLEAPEFRQMIEPVLAAGGIQLENPKIAELGSGLARVPLVTTDAAPALAGADIVLFLVPAFAERRFAEMIAPHVRPDQLLVLFCGSFGGALELAAYLRGAGAPVPLIAEAEALVYAALKSGPTSVRIMGRKAGVGVSALPAGKVSQVLDRLRPLYPDLVARADVLETGLRHTGPIAHVAATVLNAGRIDPSVPPFRFYREGFPGPVARVAAQTDAERLRVAEAFGFRLASTMDTMLAWYSDQGAHGSTLGEVLSTNPPFQATLAPQTLQHRFLTEEVPFGFVPLEGLGKVCGVPTPAVSSLITLASLLLDTDLRAGGRNLQRLGLGGLTRQEIARILQA
jgi:opine dehydrogenase